MDASIGIILARLADPNGDGDTSDSILENTLILFSSDNGATPEDGSPANNANIDGNLRGGKRDLYEGGIRMPGVAYWNGTITPGSSTDLLNDLADLQATAAQLAGTHARVGVDGVSILPTLDPTGAFGLQRQRDFLLFENFENSQLGHPNTRWAIIRGNDKLILRADGTLELYNLANDPTEASPLNLAVATNAALRDELQAYALAEGAGQSDNYATSYRDWTGSDGDTVTDPTNWAVTDGGTSAVGAINDTWSALLRNTNATPANATLNTSINTLGFEVSGDTARQTVTVAAGQTLTGRNEVRVGALGTLDLQNATAASRRWVDVLPTGQLLGTGTIDSNLYNAGTISPGHDTGATPPQPPAAGPQAVAFDFTGIPNTPNKDDAYTPMTQTVGDGQATASLDYGPSAGSALFDRAAVDFANEFNLSGWSTNNTLQSAIDGNHFLAVTIDPAPGLSVELDQASFTFWRNGSGSPRDFAITTSLDGFTPNDALASLNVTNAGSANAVTFNATGTDSLSTTGPLEVRLYGYNANAGNGHIHLTAATLNLTFATVPFEPLSPIGTLTVTGDLHHLADADLVIDLDENNASDTLAVLGDATLAGHAVFRLADDYTPTPGDTFDFLTGTNITGTFATLAGTDLGNGLTLAVTYDNQTVTATVVPQPATAAALSLLARRPRRRH